MPVVGEKPVHRIVEEESPGIFPAAMSGRLTMCHTRAHMHTYTHTSFREKARKSEGNLIYLGDPSAAVLQESPRAIRMKGDSKAAASSAPGKQKTISSFFTKAPAPPAAASHKTPPTSAKKESPVQAKRADDVDDGNVMVIEEMPKKSPPASDVKKRKDPPTARDTPVQPPADDNRMRMDDMDEDDDGIAMRKSTRRRVVPVSLAESSDEHDEADEEQEEEGEETTPASSKNTKESKARAAGGSNSNNKLATSGEGMESSSTNQSSPWTKKNSTAVVDKIKDEGAKAPKQQPGAAAGQADKKRSRLSASEQERIHDKFVKKVSLIAKAAGPESDSRAHARDSSVGGTLLPTKMVVERGNKLTPMEEQVVAIKNKNPDIVLLVECGYKFKFFGRDAEIASRVLNIFHHMDHNFYVASIPVQRVDVHSRRLVEAGYMVGIVRQMENAALKAVSDTKSKGFARELCEVYTKSTMLVEDVHVLEGPATSIAQAGAVYMMCIYEEEVGSNGEVEVGMVAVDTGSGDIVYDCFRDDTLRSQLETRVSHLMPKEMLMPDNLTPHTSKLLTRMAVGRHARLQGIASKHLAKGTAEGCIKELFSSSSEEGDAVTREVGEEMVGCVAEGRLEEQGMRGILSLPGLAVQCIGGLIHYLKQFKLHQVLRLTGNMWRFSSRTHMLLDAQVLSNLEVVANEAEGTEQGSLVWLLKATKTAFGARLLRHWVAHPLLEKRRIVDRHEAVEELMDAPAAAEPIAALLKGLPDLERAVARIHYGKCAPNELLALLNALSKVSDVAKEASEMASSLSSSLLRSLIGEMPDLSGIIQGFMDDMNQTAAQQAKGSNYDKKQLLQGFERESEYPAIVELKVKAREVEAKMEEHLSFVRKMLRLP